MATASSSSAAAPAPAPTPARPWVMIDRIARVKDQGNLSVEVAAPPLVSFATVPRSLYHPPKHADSDKRRRNAAASASEDRGALSIAVPERLRVANLVAPANVHAKHNRCDNTEKYLYIVAAEGEGREDFSAAPAVKPRNTDLSAPFSVAADGEDLSAAPAVKPRNSDLFAPFNVAADGEDREYLTAALAVNPRNFDFSAPFSVTKTSYDDTGKLSCVVATADDASYKGTGKHTYSVADDDTGKQPYLVAAADACLLFHVAIGPFVGLDLGRAPRRILLVAHGFVPADAAGQRDAATAATVRVPDRCLDQPAISNMTNVGIVSLPGSDGAEFAVAELRPVEGAEGRIGRATLLSFRSGGKESWVERDLPCSSSLRGWPKVWHEVIAHDGTLWWVNHAWGLLGCTMFANEHEPVLGHVELPPPASTDNGAMESPLNIEVKRMVRVSQGKLVCVEISSDPARDVDETVVIINLLNFGPEGQSSWEIQCTITLGAIWATESYRGTGMPEEVPVLALLHPSNTGVVCFGLKQYLFSINLAQRTVLQFVQVVDQPISWCHVLAWELPPSLSHEISPLDICRTAAAEGEACTGQLEEGAVEGTKSRLRCVACQKGTAGKICGRCTRLIKKKLLGEARNTMLVPGNHDLRYCLVCHELKREHDVHEANCIPISSYEGDIVAWASGKESWASIFLAIQSDRCWRPTMGRPYLLYSPKGIECTVCSDLLTKDDLYGSFLTFCCIKCWARGGGNVADVAWIEEMVAQDFDDGTDAFCLFCGVAFHSKDDNGHEEHQYIGIIPDSLGRRPRLQLPSEHQLLHMWDSVTKQEDPIGGSTEMLIRDDQSLRCWGCKMRLLDGGGHTCSFECSLPLPPPLLPRPLLCK